MILAIGGMVAAAAKAPEDDVVFRISKEDEEYVYMIQISTTNTRKVKDRDKLF